MTQNTLSDEVKTYIVQQLACFDPPSVVARAVKDEFGLDLTRQGVEIYDPTKRSGKDLSEGYRLLFAETRKAFLEDTASIGIAHRTVRLRNLARMAQRAEDMKNLALAAQLHEQAAKEMGNSFTNRREIAGPGGGPLKVITTTMSPQEAAEAYAATLDGDD